MTVPSTTANRRLASSPSQVLNRQKVVTFTVDGKEHTAFEGDTIASALAAAGVTTFSRSFKYHRQRGLLCVAGNCPNCLVQVGDEPNVRSCSTAVRAGMAVRSQNAWPSLGADVMTFTQLVDRFLPAGFYYKAFMHPRMLWPFYERVLRHAAGLGKVNPDARPGYFDKIYKHTDVTVVGGGPAGLKAALAAASAGAQVTLIETEPVLGGHLRYSTQDVGGHPAYEYGADLIGPVLNNPRIEVLVGTTAVGRYENNWIGAQSGDRLVKLRTQSLVVATGGYEIPLLFENNDLPGIMLGSGVRRLMHLWGILPGTHAVVVSSNPRGLQTALDLHRAGLPVAAVADMRSAPEDLLVRELRSAGIEVMTSAVVLKANGSGRVNGVVLKLGGQTREIACDLLVLSTGYMPANELLFQAGSTLNWNDSLNEFVANSLPENVFAAGEVTATHALEAIEREGELAGLQAAAAAGFNGSDQQVRATMLTEEITRDRSVRFAWTAANPAIESAKKDFVCFCEDVTRKDVKQSIDEGYSSMELLKRYSTISMGPCQGKMCNMSAIRLCAHYNASTVSETGTTTSRPPVRPLLMGALGGRAMDPVRLTPMHDWHVQHGARMMNAGVWKRPEHYGDPAAEVRAVRESVGLIDISTLGKLHLHGPDVSTLLERLYVNRWRKLGNGRVRYGLMLNHEGVVMDDGVTACLSNDFYYMTATSSGATAVYEWIESGLQGGWMLNVHVLEATELRAAMNITGPLAREVLGKVTEGVDLSREAFPYMNARQGTVAGAPALLLRVGFTGELGYEIHVPSGFGLQVWEALMEAGKSYGIRPFGVEAQRVLRLEKGHIIVGQDTDGLTNPLEAGLQGLVKLDKDDFIGKHALIIADSHGIKKRLVGFEIPDGTLPEEGNQIVKPGSGPIGLQIIGRITSVRRSPTLNKVIGLCWVPAEMAEPGQVFTIRVRGELINGRVVSLPAYDPENARLNS